MNYYCCNDSRRNAVKLHPVLNGIDFLEVLDDISDPYNERQTTLFVHFLKPLGPTIPDKSNFVIEGGERIRNIGVVETIAGEDYLIPSSPPSEEAASLLVVKVSVAGDFSTYTLRLVDAADKKQPPEGFDPVMSAVEFSFKAGCESDFDCKREPYCAKEPVEPPDINYLAKDYTTFRQIMLDRMSLLMPGWKERNPSDLGITLVEMLAYSADYLSYRQDALSTEAYLDTARKRISVRRHARLVDYFMHDGCNARTWLHIKVGDNVIGLLMKKGAGADTTKIFSRQDGLPAVFSNGSKDYELALNGDGVVFEPMHDIELYTAHNEMHFHTWGEKECCLPRGATGATLVGDLSTLKTGDVLILCEALGPETGKPQDADPAHRHPVRLTSVTVTHDPLFESTGSPPGSDPFPVTEITWDIADALPFPLCISSHDGTENISVALGNNVLADHGLTFEDGDESSLTPFVVPSPAMTYTKDSLPGGCVFCDTPVDESVPARFNPKLLKAPLTASAPVDFDDLSLPAWSFMNWSMRKTMPAITLLSKIVNGENVTTDEWHPQKDLLNSADSAKEFVVESESDSTAYLRFGDGIQGERPVADMEFYATYRIGNGTGGNVGRETLAHLSSADAAVIGMLKGNTEVWNPLVAEGGMEPETIEEVRQKAPEAFRTQQRTVIPEDYERFAKVTKPDIQRTATTFRWTGSWRTSFLTVDRFGGTLVDTLYEQQLRDGLERYRLAGIDLEVDDPIPVSLELEIKVCVNRNYFVSDVKAALLREFGNRILPDGRKGVFHPDNFTFGQTVFLSKLYAAAQSVQGVDSLMITRLARQGDDNNDAVDTGKLILERREIARLDNDPDFPEHGTITLDMSGGR